MLPASCRVAAAVLLAAAAASAAAGQDRKTAVDFNRDVRPILSGKCFQCHGPDDKVRKAGLRLDRRDSATAAGRKGRRAVVPGNPAASELYRRITADEDEVMPPPKVGKPLTTDEIATLKRWLAEGAPYAQHWAYVKPVRPEPPAVKDRAWPINPVDAFLLARMEKEGLHPAPAADRWTLARRLALDLTGLPPTVEEVDRFVADKSPTAYEDLVERFLAKPAYGERWAHVWLDLARYADSQGYANDPERTIWRWRDWVIEALNANMPFDRFTVEQLAGDLLPQPTTSQLIATGFHRNTLTNTEGGTTPEEFRSAAVVDRVNTTLEVWMGVTIGCAQCHNHKYDPFSQKEYYQLYAVFNNCEDANRGDDAPTLKVARVGWEQAFADASARLARLRKQYDEETRKVDVQRPEWEKAVDRKTLPRDVADILALPAARRDKKQTEKLIAYQRSTSAAWKALDAQVQALNQQLSQESTTTPILREIGARPTHVHIRGNFLDRGEQVGPGLPAVFAPEVGAASRAAAQALPGPASRAGPTAPLNRLALARWLVSPDNPLTARVAVNRLWEELFGIGIVETSENFGAQGEPPFHPELLDYLATEYVRLGWDAKKMLKLLVTSAAYRQSSQVSEELARRDPNNRLLARGPRVRLSAETIRDQALFVSGLLSPRLYGTPVQPPRPSFGLTAAFGGTTDWVASTGADKYRRGLYILWRRNAPYPSMTTFDAPERTVCNVRRLRTNTPLQALVTLNDPVYVEASQALARRMVTQGGGTAAERARYGFRLCLARPPRDEEVQRLVGLFDKARAQYQSVPQDATAMATKPLGPAPGDTNVVDLAAWTVVANVLLNLDETLAKR
jgi:hypothetical protein